MPRELWNPHPLTAAKAREAFEQLFEESPKKRRFVHIVPRASEYHYIAAWGKMRNHTLAYVHSVQVAAFAENAPANAISQRSPGVWNTAHELDEESLRLLEADVALIRTAQRKRKRQAVLV